MPSTILARLAREMPLRLRSSQRWKDLEPRQQVVLPDALGRALDDGGWILPGLKDLADDIVFGDEAAHFGFGKGQFGEEVGAKARTIKIIQAQDALALIFGQKLTSVESQVAALGVAANVDHASAVADLRADVGQRGFLSAGPVEGRDEVLLPANQAGVGAAEGNIAVSARQQEGHAGKLGLRGSVDHGNGPEDDQRGKAAVCGQSLDEWIKGGWIA